ncbi:MAG: hypothetical protein IK080_06065, partial [Clostridia bacterium]|nr:hypothetical protein [Clostridia bacterium]
QFCGSRNCSEKGKAAHGILDVCQCGFDAFMGDLCPAKPILDYETLPLPARSFFRFAAAITANP